MKNARGFHLKFGRQKIIDSSQLLHQISTRRRHNQRKYSETQHKSILAG